MKYLIEMLASKNPAPKIFGERDGEEKYYIDYGKKYKDDLQVPVYLAIQQLLERPELVRITGQPPALFGAGRLIVAHRVSAAFEIIH